MINSGEKKDEYRYLSYYWCSRFLIDYHRTRKEKYGGPELELIAAYEFKKWDVVTFINGYKPTSPRMTFKFLGLDVDCGSPEWGALTGRKYFVIKLGERIS